LVLLSHSKATPFSLKKPASNGRENQRFERVELSQKSAVYSMSVEPKSLVFADRFPHRLQAAVSVKIARLHDRQTILFGSCSD
jgi:hypothetical protein